MDRVFGGGSSTCLCLEIGDSTGRFDFELLQPLGRFEGVHMVFPSLSVLSARSVFGNGALHKDVSVGFSACDSLIEPRGTMHSCAM
jgi:hypothetical protein